MAAALEENKICFVIIQLYTEMPWSDGGLILHTLDDICNNLRTAATLWNAKEQNKDIANG